MSFIHQVLDNQLKKTGGNVSQLSRNLGVSDRTLRRWIDDGSEPSAKNVENILKLIGGDIKRALPDWTPPNEMLAAHASPTKVIGVVTAGAAFIQDQPIESDGVMESTFSDSPYWHYGTGEVVFLRVSGNSMEPTYPERTLLACRQNATDKRKIKKNTPSIILTSNGETTFKLWQWNEGYNRGFAVPINDDYEIQIYKEENVDVQLIVVGAIQHVGNRAPITPLNHQTKTAAFTGSGMVLRENVAEDSPEYGEKE